jgi:hypothetical protein
MCDKKLTNGSESNRNDAPEGLSLPVEILLDGALVVDRSSSWRRVKGTDSTCDLFQGITRFKVQLQLFKTLQSLP